MSDSKAGTSGPRHIWRGKRLLDLISAANTLDLLQRVSKIEHTNVMMFRMPNMCEDQMRQHIFQPLFLHHCLLSFVKTT